MKAVIVIPTYNEKENIGELLDKVQSAASGLLDHSIDVLVVDDNSPDGTQEVVRDYMSRYRNISLIAGEKRGLGDAYARGMSYAMKNMNADIVFEMDADLSHDPALIPKFIAEIENGADMVLGSRFVSGGSIPSDWPFVRKFLSVAGNLFGRLLLGLFKIKDVTTGYRATRVKGFLEKLDFSRLISRSYAYKIQLLFEIASMGARIKEVPINFVDRKAGSSKMRFRDFAESLKVVLVLALRRRYEFFKFCVVGGIGFLVNTFFLYLFTDIAKVHYVLSNIPAVELAIASNFLLNNYWTFRRREVSSNILVRFVKFNLTSIGSPIISTAVLYLLTHFLGLYYLLSNAIGVILGLVWNYLWGSLWVWARDKKESARSSCRP